MTDQLKEGARYVWEEPMVFDVTTLPDVLGNCVAGSTETGTTCQNGQATPATSGHSCLTGGATRTCTVGSVAI